VKVVGIYSAGSTTAGPNEIARNLVHSLSITSTDTLSSVRGIHFDGGPFTAENNIVYVGLDASGASTAAVSGVIGIYDANSTAVRNFYHNSVYVGGTQHSGATSTVAFTSDGASNTRAFHNNIFVNARGSSGGTGTHYAVSYNGNGANPTGLTANNNLFFVSGTGGVLGFYDNSDQITVSDWQTATGVDAASIFADPFFVNPTGTAATLDLHLQSASPARGAGAVIAGVTDDFDGNLRSLTAPDIGADEFCFPNDANLTALTLSSGTLSAPFDANTLSYNAAVSNGTATLTFTPVRSSAQATVTVNGGRAATPVTLNLGTNHVSIAVTAQDGSMTTYTVTVMRRTVFQDRAVANAVSRDPGVSGANGAMNVGNFAFGMDPNSAASGPLVYTGTFAGGGSITATGQPITRTEGADRRALFVRRKDYANAGLTYAVRFSSDFSVWLDSTATPTVLADDGTHQIVSVPFPAGFTASGFFGVRVSLP